MTLTSIIHNGFDYSFTYDGMGRTEDVIIAGNLYSSTLHLFDDTAIITSYASGENMTVGLDGFKQPNKLTYTDINGTETVLSETEYDSLGRVTKAIDNTTETEYNYTYDGLGNLTECRYGNYIISNVFDSNNRQIYCTVNTGDNSIIIETILLRYRNESILSQ